MNEPSEAARMNGTGPSCCSVLATINRATDGATEGCGLAEAVDVLISQRDNARNYAETFRAKLKELGHEFV